MLRGQAGLDPLSALDLSLCLVQAQAVAAAASAVWLLAEAVQLALSLIHISEPTRPY